MGWNGVSRINSCGQTQGNNEVLEVWPQSVAFSSMEGREPTTLLTQTKLSSLVLSRSHLHPMCKMTLPKPIKSPWIVIWLKENLDLKTYSFYLSLKNSKETEMYTGKSPSHLIPHPCRSSPRRWWHKGPQTWDCWSSFLLGRALFWQALFPLCCLLAPSGKAHV